MSYNQVPKIDTEAKKKVCKSNITHKPGILFSCNIKIGLKIIGFLLLCYISCSISEFKTDGNFLKQETTFLFGIKDNENTS